MASVQREPREETDRIVELHDEVNQLKDAVTSHAVVDQAIGMLVALGRVTSDQGFSGGCPRHYVCCHGVPGALS